jgi:hypothetical protein
MTTSQLCLLMVFDAFFLLQRNTSSHQKCDVAQRLFEEMQAGIREDTVCGFQVHLVHPILHAHTALSD